MRVIFHLTQGSETSYMPEYERKKRLSLLGCIVFLYMPVFKSCSKL